MARKKAAPQPQVGQPTVSPAQGIELVQRLENKGEEILAGEVTSSAHAIENKTELEFSLAVGTIVRTQGAVSRPPKWLELME
jgi:hypothetical protein